MARLRFLALAIMRFACPASGLDVARYDAVKGGTAARAFLQRESVGCLPLVTCAARCNRRNRTWPLQQCNAYARDPATGECEIGNYDAAYEVQPGDEAIAGKDVFLSGLGVDYLVLIGGQISGTRQTLAYVKREDGSLCSGHNIPELPAGRDVHALHVYRGSRLYVAGGRVGSPAETTADFLMLDLEEGAPRAWHAEEPLPLAVKSAGLESVDGTIFLLGGTLVNTIAEYDVAADAWTTLPDELPFTVGCSIFTMKVSETLVWVMCKVKLAAFDMGTKSLRSDISIPDSPANVDNRAAVVNVGASGKLVIAAVPKDTTTVYTIDPDNPVSGWATVTDGLPSVIASANTLVSMHKGKTAVFLYTQLTKNWRYYDVTTGKFVEGGTVPGIADVKNVACAIKAVPAMYFPECRAA